MIDSDLKNELHAFNMDTFDYGKLKRQLEAEAHSKKTKTGQSISIHGEIEKMRQRAVKAPTLDEKLKTLNHETFNTGTIDNAD